MTSSDNTDSIKDLILLIGQKIFTAIQQKDLDTLSQYLADDFVQHSSDGSEADKEAFLRDIGSMPVTVTAISGEHLTVNIYGDVAVMTGVQRADWTDGEAAHGASSVSFCDVFIQRDGAWRLALAHGVELQS